MPVRRPCRKPSFELLEDRLTPAFDLTISTAITSDVSDVLASGVRTFTATGVGANLDVTDVRDALIAGEDVVIATGTDGDELGDITWDNFADLAFDGIGTGRQLSLLTNASSGGGRISISVSMFDLDVGSADSLELILDTTATDGNISLLGVQIGEVALDVAAGAGDAAFAGEFGGGPHRLLSLTVQADQIDVAATIESDGPVTLTAAQISSNHLAVSTASADIVLDGDLDLGGLQLDTTLDQLPGGDIQLGPVTTAGPGHMSLSAGAGSVDLTGDIAGVGSLRVIAATTFVNGDIIADGGPNPFIEFFGDVEFTGPGTVRSITADGSSGSLILFREGTVSVDRDLIVDLPGPGDDFIDLFAVDFNLGSNDLTVLDGLLRVLAGSTLAGAGTITATLEISSDGTLAPGGLDTAGTLAIVGDLSFVDDGVLNVDLGTTSDLLTVDGDVVIQDGILDGTGLPSPGPDSPPAAPITVLSVLGAGHDLTGSFDNAPPGTPFMLGLEAHSADYTPTELRLALAAPGPKTVRTLGLLGDLVTVKLLGGGGAQLIVAGSSLASVADDNLFQGLSIVVRNATAANTLQITVTPNGGTGTMAVDQVSVFGSIGKIIAPGVLMLGDLTVTGKLGSLKMMSFGLPLAFDDSSDLVTVNLGGDASNTTALNVSQITSTILRTPGRIAKLTSNLILGLDLEAHSLGKLLVQRNLSLPFSGVMAESELVLTGAAAKGQLGLGQAKIVGAVVESAFHVLNGNVGSFIAGRFGASQLHVGYNGGPDLALPGTFTGNFKINVFRTTSKPANPPAPHLATDGFFASQVVASRVGTVRLSGVTLDNGGAKFGFRVDDVAGNVGSFRIATTPFNPLTNYLPSSTGAVTPAVAQGDFAFFV